MAEQTELTSTFAVFDVQHRAALLRFAMALTGDYHMSQDLVADAMGRAFERWDKIRIMQSPVAYVRRMIVNDHISWRRRWKKTAPTPIPDEAIGGGYNVDDWERREQIAALLAKLTRRQRAAIVLRYYSDQSIEEIANQLGCSAATVRSHLSHGLKTLRIEVTTDASLHNGA